ncbi:MAG: hypothetical protein PWQ10_289 [Patescibacteria group bacterium]|nr:hypothetical protein [Patescibacteria group bacterium]
MLSLNNKTTLKDNIKQNAFTIVELLVVIVVIGILASIVTVSYIGITAKANATVLISDLTNARDQFILYQAKYASFPTALENNCPTAPISSSDYCIEPSSGVAFEFIPGGATAYSLKATKSDLTYIITNKSNPVAYVEPTTIPITSISSITGTPQVFQTLTAGTITPSDATVSYQWQSSTTSDGTYTNITGATNNTYPVTSAYLGKYIRVVVTGIDNYTGTQTSTTPTAIATNPDWLTIGTQTWAKKNLNVGTLIASNTDQANNSVIEKYCYNNTESNCTTYGGLYQWNEAMQYTDTEGAQGICPAGSHIPSDNDWKILEMQLGMTQAQADAEGDRGTDQGTKLKPGGSSGLNILLAGFLNTGGSFYYMSSYNRLWSSSYSVSSASWNRGVDTSQSGVTRHAYSKTDGFSVRCLGN